MKEIAKNETDITKVSGCWKNHPDAWKTYPDALKGHPDAWNSYPDALKRYPDTLIFQLQNDEQNAAEWIKT